MNCWEILGISPTDDKKKIKLSYSRKLKHCRPEDHPIEFEMLHNCYKQALELSNSLNSKDSNCNEVIDGALPAKVDNFLEESSVYKQKAPVQNHVSIDFSNTIINTETHITAENEVVIDSQIELSDYQRIIETDTDLNVSIENISLEQQRKERKLEHQQEISQELNRLINQSEALLSDTHKGRKLQDWYFIESSNMFDDLEFKSKLSDIFFHLVMKTNIDTSASASGSRFGISFIEYFNRLFFWDNKWRAYSKIYDSTSITFIYKFLSLDSDKQKKQRRDELIKENKSIYYVLIALYTIIAIFLSVQIYITQQPKLLPFFLLLMIFWIIRTVIKLNKI